ncbi:MAG: phosphoribosylglycinamide formyltransferase [Solirubrobacterales bacterium]|nr:phosphoribosylglycinamide formyltransferase [Solirubrobacterales bacterium]
MTALRVAVLASGSGTNLQAILDNVHGHDGIEVVGVLSDRRDSHALERAAKAGVEAAAFDLRPGQPGEAFSGDRRARDSAMAAWLVEREVGLVVLAGYMQVLDPLFLDHFPHAVINVHPSLLPAFAGLDAIGQAVTYGVRVFGVTVHFVDEGVDSGPVILQRSIELASPHSSKQVHDLLRPIEHELLTDAVKLIAAGRVSLDPSFPRRVVITAPA